ncbi:threonine/serine exporter family protein [Dysosmobacter sp.]|uniref:threonine/serine exporter family protein n=1 Tax=Dysosmobacter sp. TaxID=2591382 RepID=UPI002A8FE94B|nr:threonine/serine exporter family protein [Dysosmobacter sp.]MDY3985716.1 threonine/serine exporter family protein [Dysosmobacter sp.]
MTSDETEQLLDLCCEMGRQLIQNGAEIYRVEESARRILAAYGHAEAEVFAIPSCVILNIRDGQRNYTKSVRIRSSSNDLDKLDRLNDLCRQICRETPPPSEAAGLLETVTNSPSYPACVSFLAHGCVAAFFTLFWGGRASDAAVAFLCGLAVKATVGSMSRLNANVFFTDVCASAFLAFIPTALFCLGLPIRPDRIIIGAIMLLVPGIAITNVMRDVIAGDFLTAITKFAEVMIVAMAIAIGIALPVGAVKALLGGL